MGTKNLRTFWFKNLRAAYLGNFLKFQLYLCAGGVLGPQNGVNE